ncbi:hypothetical protein [Pseudidiomarina insulisalsae]|uniref:Uncharacterized protein n=1 Tax=Pseudidiomarina insulisalsae TaxID=575789 RepID=A0A432YQD6_9GAMM|nr:hypothetical protein [Pseudidiomarina insulisalsae]RUO63557.1 hypothetical protein CWI71_00395 [Pseudidiomarina insulisalsae]
MRKYVIEPAQLNNIAAGWRDASAASVLTHLATPFRHAPEESEGLALIALGNTDGLRHEVDSLTGAHIEKNPLALKFLELFVDAN